MKKYCVYTVIVGGFDEVKQPIVVDERFDYVLFTDVSDKDFIGVWKVRKLPQDMFAVKDVKRQHFLLSRFPKVHPEVCLSGYEASLYIDGTIQIASSWVYNRCIELHDIGIEWAGIKHQYVDDIFTEMNAIVGVRWNHDYDVLDWYKYLVTHGYSVKESAGFMYENNVIFRIHTENVKRVNDIWWWSIENYVKRDQFSLMYSLWKIPEIKLGFFLNENENAWTNGGQFIYTNHNPHNRVLKISLGEQIRCSCWKAKVNKERPYIEAYDIFIKFHNPRVGMEIWTIYALLRYGYKILLKKMKLMRERK